MTTRAESRTHIRCVLAIVLLLLPPFVNGCVMTPTAQSDLEWQRMNPNYRPPIEPDPRPQWGIFSVPNS